MPSYWLAIGPPDNWAFCFDHNNIWGFTVHNEKAWESLANDDILLCYATSPVMGLIGYGTITSKQRDEYPLFPQERQAGKGLWPLRLTLVRSRIIPRQRWSADRVALVGRTLNMRRGLQTLPRETAKLMIKRVDEA